MNKKIYSSLLVVLLFLVIGIFQYSQNSKEASLLDIIKGFFTKGVENNNPVLNNPVFLPGWPVSTGPNNVFNNPPSVADINNDGEIELTATNSNGIYVWKANGDLLLGWPFIVSSGNLGFAPSLVDIDRDKNLEIFGGAYTNKQYGVYGDGILINGWPQEAIYKFFGTSVVGDLDNNGDMEIINGHQNPGKIYVWNHDGSLFSGWPQDVPGTFNDVRGIAIADLDKNGDLEIMATDRHYIYVWNHDGTAFSPWPIEPQPRSQNIPGYPGTYYNNPYAIAVGDVNGDGNLEIVSFTYNAAGYSGAKRIWIHVFNINGTELQGFPIEVSSGLSGTSSFSLTLANLNNDNALEIIIPTASKLIVVRSNGSYSFLPEVDVPDVYTYGSKGAIVANIDADRDKEILSPIFLDNVPGLNGDEWGEIYAWNIDGTVVEGFPIRLPWYLSTMLTIADIDRDGRSEIAGGYRVYADNGLDIVDAGVYVLKLNASYNSRQVEWGTFAHDFQHTNWYRKILITATPTAE